MSKRSAVIVAAFLVAAMALGGFAMSLGVAGPTSAAASTRPRTERVVEVQRRTVTIHRKADAPSAGAATATTVTLPAGSDDEVEVEDGVEHESDDDGSEHEVEHEDHDEIEVEDD